MQLGTSLFYILSLRIKQFGGMRVIRIYARLGVLKPMMNKIIHNPFNRQSYKNAYSVALQGVEPYLREKFVPVMNERASYYKGLSLEHKRNNIIWFCWLQGLENAPNEVKVCYRSLLRNLPGREVKVIDADNWKEFVELPDYIIKKWEKTIIPPALFSDLLRLQLLIKYGGTWIDSTVLCTGFTPENVEYTKSYIDTDLFFFQYTQLRSAQWRGIGNWFITACTNNEVLMTLRDMLYVYWAQYDCLVDYYIFHLFFSMTRDVFPKEIGSMPYGYAVPSINLVHHWGEKYDKEKWERFTSKVCFHKLAYLVKSDVKNGKDNYYQYIMNNF